MPKSPGSPHQAPSLVWFRDDLRLGDHPALHAAIARGAPLLCIYIFEEGGDDLRPHGRLDLLRGQASTIIPALTDASKDQGTGLIPSSLRSRR
jgi:hypothetical protein